MIIKQSLTQDDEGNLRLKNTFDVSQAMLESRLATDNGGRVKLAKSEVFTLGSIPVEMWQYDPWLMEANKARNYGDMAEYQRLIMKFFEVHPQFRTITGKKYW